MKKIKNILIVLKPNDLDSFRDFLPTFIDFLYKHNCNLYFFSFEQERLKQISPNTNDSINFIEKNRIDTNIELVLSLGGDGTLIGFCREFSNLSCPIFSINIGKLGFLTEFSKDNYRQELAKTLNGNFKTNELRPFSVKVFHEQRATFTSNFINDIVIGRNNISRLVNLSICVEDEPIFNIFGDGIIISTPHGSTAYSLSAGGPIIHPSVNALVITPICAHSLNTRPLVIPNTKTIKIFGLDNDDSMILTIDGQFVYDIKNESYVQIINTDNQPYRLIKNPDKTYFNNLKEKFLHGKRL